MLIDKMYDLACNSGAMFKLLSILVKLHCNHFSTRCDGV